MLKRLLSSLYSIHDQNFKYLHSSLNRFNKSFSVLYKQETFSNCKETNKKTMFFNSSNFR